MIILAIDSGIERTGWAIVEKVNSSTIRYHTSGLITTSAKSSTANRLLKIHNELNDLIEKYKPETIVIEQLFFFKNQKTIIPVAQAQGVAQLLAAQHAIPLELLTPLQIKQIMTGYGNADKKSVQKMVVLTLQSTPGVDLSKKIDDEIDAIACGLAYCYLNKNLL